MDEYYSTRHIAKSLNVNILTVRRWIEKGTLPAYKINKDYRIKKVDFDRFLQERRVRK